MAQLRALYPRHRPGTRLHVLRLRLLGPPPLPGPHNGPLWVHNYPPSRPARTALQLNSPPSHRPPKQSTSRPVPGACEPETAASGHLAGPWGVLCRRVGARLVHCRQLRLAGPRLGLPRVPEGGFPSKVVQMIGKRELNRSVDKARHHRGARKKERAERGQGTYFTPWDRDQAPNLYSRSQMPASDIVENHPTRFFVKFYALNVYCRPISPTPAPCTTTTRRARVHFAPFLTRKCRVRAHHDEIFMYGTPPELFSRSFSRRFRKWDFYRHAGSAMLS